MEPYTKLFVTFSPEEAGLEAVYGIIILPSILLP
jgi:hypothetical protein